MSEEKVSLTNFQAASNPQERGYVPPAELIPLPSEGLVYPVGSPLANVKVLEIKAMTAKEEDILTSRALLKQGKALDVLLKSCVLNKGVNVDQMLSGDRNAALVAIRVTGYGQNYAAEITCPTCSEKSKYEFDLSQLPIKRLGQQPVQPNCNEFEFTLPSSNQKVTFKLLTGADESELSNVMFNSRKLGAQNEQLVTTRLLFQIVSMDGERERSKLVPAIMNMRASDSRALRKHMDDVAPGVDMRQEFDCVQCGEKSEVDIPMGMEFFWPST